MRTRSFEILFDLDISKYDIKYDYKTCIDIKSFKI